MSPTGPQPTTVTTSPFSIRASVAQSYPVVKMSPTNSACSSVIDVVDRRAARGRRWDTRTYSACAPATSPKNDPYPKTR